MTIITRSGDETQVNTTTAMAQTDSQILALANGQYIIAWNDNVDLTASGDARFANADIRAQLFNADGSRAGAEFVVANASGMQSLRDAIQLDNGNILFLWQEGPNGTPAASYIQQFSSTGAALSPATQVGANGAQPPVIAALSNGGYVASWREGSGSTGTVLAQIFGNDGAPIGSQINVATSDVAAMQPDIVALPTGGFTVGWANSFGLDYSQLFMQQYDSSGATVPTNTPSLSLTGSINFDLTLLADGKMAITTVRPWVLSPGLYEATITILDDNEQWFGGTQIVDIDSPSFNITALRDSGFVTTWAASDTQYYNVDGSGTGIRTAFYNSNGNRIFVEPTDTWMDFTVNQRVDGNQLSPTVAILADGSVVMSWTDAGMGDGNQSSIQSQNFAVLAVNRAPIATEAFVSYYYGSHYQISAYDLLDAAIDLDGDRLTVVAVGNAENGTVSLTDNKITFVPSEGYSGPAIFDYTVSDGLGGTATARAMVTGPIDDSITVRGITPVTINLGANDYLPLDSSAYDIVIQPLGNDLPNQAFTLTGTTSYTLSPEQFIVRGQNGAGSYLNFNSPDIAYRQFNYSIIDRATGLVVRESSLTVTFEGWTIAGTSAVETLTGTELADHLRSNGGADTLIGLGGDDFYTVTTPGTIVVEAVDGGFDIVQTALTNYVLADNVENLRFSTNASVVGMGNGSDNEIWSSAGNDVLNGGAGNDVLRAGSGNDTLIGGEGVDRLYGSNGNDSYFTDARDLVFESATGGYDIVYASESFTLNAASHVEVLATVNNLATTVINLTGNELNNYIVGNAGRNTLDGAAGADLLDGRGGDDSYFVDAQDNVLEAADGGYDVVYARESFTLTAGVHVEVLATVDNLATTAINLTGNELNNYLVGNAGNNVLNGQGGADYLDGRDGDDSYFVDADDVVIEHADGGVDIVYARESFSLAAGTSIELLATVDNLATTAINLTGNELNNYLVGNAGNNVLDGQGGRDYLDGRDGDDSYFVDAQDVVIEHSDCGSDTVYARESFTLGAGASVELLATANNLATTVINLTGNELRNSLSGNEGNNILNGGAGDDYLQGRGGWDIFMFNRGTGADAVLDFTSGEDRIDLSAFSLSFAQIQALFSQSGSGGYIHLGGGDSVYLYNTQLSALTASDFILSSDTAAASLPEKVVRTVLDGGWGVTMPELLHIGANAELFV